MATSTWKSTQLILGILTLTSMALASMALASMTTVPPNGITHRYEQWKQSPSSFACAPHITGLLCAEWEYTQPYLAPTICCVPPSAIGTNDLSACEIWLGGTLRIDDID